MLRLRLTQADLADVRVAPGPAPMTELAAFVRLLHAPATRGLANGGALVGLPRETLSRVALLGDLLTWRCSPGFMLPTIRDGAEAIGAVVSTPHMVVRRDLEGMAEVGQPPAQWTADLVRPGQRGLATRRGLGDTLALVLERSVAPTLRRARPLVNAAIRDLDERLRSEGAAAVLDTVHPRVRFADPILEIDLVSGAEVTASASGAGLVLVPSLVDDPTVTISSDGSSPAVLSVPVGRYGTAVSSGSGIGHGESRSGNLHGLIGAGRATVLEAIALRPGSSTTRVAADAGMSPASVSEHARVLRDNNLVVTLRQGGAVAHFATELGRTLLDG